MDKLFSIEEVAKMLAVTPDQVNRLVSEGELGAYRIGSQRRISQSQLNDYLSLVEIKPGKNAASATPATRVPVRKAVFHSSREAEVERRVNDLARNFNHYVEAFDRAPAFRRDGQLEYHRSTIAMRLDLGSVSAACASDDFLRWLWHTLQKWGIGGRRSVLKPFDLFCLAARSRESDMAALEGIAIDQPGLEPHGLAERIWRLMSDLEIVDNDAKLVSSAKFLHHLLPELVPPIDRKFSRQFFGWHVPEFQYKQEQVFRRAFISFARVSREARARDLVTGTGWRTSVTKLVDNAVVAYCEQNHLPMPS